MATTLPHDSYLDLLADAVLILGRDGRTRYANLAASSFFARPRDALIGQSFGLPKIVGESSEIDIPRPDGTVVYGEMRAAEIDYLGEACILASIRDVTGRVVAERHVRESEQRLRSAFDSAVHGMGLADPAGRWTRVNKSLSKILELNVAALVGCGMTQFVDESDRPHLTEYLSRIRDEAMGVFQRELRIRGAAGNLRHVIVSIGGVTDEDGAAVYLVVQMIDITDWRAAEEQLHQAQKMEAIGQMTGGIAHDFNNILGVVLGSLQLIKRTVGDDAKMAERVDRALGSAKRGAELTKRLLAFSRGQVLEPEVANINELADEVLQLATRTLGGDIEIELDQAADLWAVKVDVSQLENAILNLCVNARDAMPDGGRLRIATENVSFEHDRKEGSTYVEQGAYVCLTVADTGMGMPKEVRRRVLEPFFTTKEAGKGTGLGLSMVYGFVKQSNGFLNIHSAEGRGTTVNVYLPRVEGTAGPREMTALTTGALPGGAERILVVDDDEDSRKTACDLLETLGYTVLEAGDGPTALETLEQHANIDLVLADVVMPGGMSGVDVARSARRERPSLKVLFQSGYSARKVDLEQFDKTTTGFLAKPYTDEDLAQQLRRVLDT